MLYSRHHIDVAGENLIGTDPFKRRTALAEIGEWRETHLLVLKEFNEKINVFFKENGIVPSLSSMRIKRMTSIEDKLRNNAEKATKLGGMQDIGGIRFVFEGIDLLDKVVSLLQSFTPENFEPNKRNDRYNYVENPKESGYRSVHFVYKYHSESPVYDGLQIELQVRTTIQHAWAMAVETASLISHTTLKADIDTHQDWRGFFKLVSALFAREEGKPVHERFKDYTMKRYCQEYYVYKNQYKFIDTLLALRTTVNSNFSAIESGFCVLTIDFEKKMVYMNSFASNQEKEATATFNDIEKTISSSEAALMVAIEKLQEIKEAYPSYFLDTQQFLLHLQSFDNQCSTIK